MDKNKNKNKNKNIKTYAPCHQVLFNKPLRLTDSKLIYGFRLMEDKLEHKPFSEKRLLEYIVEGIFGKIIFNDIHHGDFKGNLDNIWIDLEGNEYKYGVQTRLYSYDATIANMMNYRWDLVYAPSENEGGEDYWITDPQDYFECKARMDTDDMKQGRNKWLENYLRIKSRKEVLSYIIAKSSENLDYDMQELIKEEWRDADGYVDMDVQNLEDELPF